MVVAEAGVKLVALAMVPIVFVTWIGPAVAPLGTVAVIWLLELTTKVALVTLKATDVAPEPLPTMTTDDPGAAGRRGERCDRRCHRGDDLEAACGHAVTARVVHRERCRPGGADRHVRRDRIIVRIRHWSSGSARREDDAGRDQSTRIR